MEFFCPKCQKKHSVTAITADLLSVCKEGIQTGLNDMVKSGKLEAKAVIQLNNLSKVISGITDRTFLAYKREDLRAMLNDVVPEANGFSGEFILTIGNLRQRLEERMPNAARPIAWEDLDDFMNVAAVRKEMTFQYAMNNEGEYVFTSCQENGDYFPDGPQGKMLLGYRRICSECGAVLHQCTGLAPELVVVLAGSPRAGKTSCITAVVNSCTSLIS